MSLADTFERVKSGVFHIVFVDPNGKILASGSGFRLGDYFITNNHVFSGPINSRVILRKESSSKINFDEDIVIEYSKWRGAKDSGGCLITGNLEDANDYAILDIEEIRRSDSFSFSIGNEDDLKVGMDIALLGFPFDSFELMCHRGIVSCIESKILPTLSNPMKIYRLDATVNVSNSGGPLINIDSGEVYGIITRKHTVLTAAFDKFEGISRRNAEILRAVINSGTASIIGGVNIIGGLERTEMAFVELSNEIKRSANVGIGYAFSISPVARDIEFHTT